MILSNVQYQLFESDAWWLDKNYKLSYHEIDGEIKLEFEDQVSLHISWDSQPAQYCICYGSQAFFSKGLPVTRPLTKSSIWRKLVGKDICLKFLDNEQQVLEIRSGENTVYCCSMEDGNWWMNTIHVTNQKPYDFPMDRETPEK